MGGGHKIVVFTGPKLTAGQVGYATLTGLNLNCEAALRIEGDAPWQEVLTK